MNKKLKIASAVIILIGIVTLLLTVHFKSSAHEISNVEVLVFACSLVFIMGGIGLYQVQNSQTKRKKYVRISFITALALVLIGFLIKYLKLTIPGAAPLAIFGTFYMSFSVIPVLAKNRYDKWKGYSDSIFQIIGLMIFDSVGLVFLLLGVLFKMQYWPGANSLLILGVFLVTAALLLWNKKFESLFSFQIESKIKLEEQHKEIVDSINYAKRIQSAILPPIRIINELLQNSFVIYKPKDIVAGDFYWLEGTKNEIYFAVADCTGHGVPGAMVSVICNGGLNRSVREFGLKDPADILGKTRELVIREFEKSDEEVKDGMDIALCKLEGNMLTYSGANNPLWLIRDGKIIERKADKQPIGKYAESKPFTSHKIKLQKGDTLYIFSDGYPDQFGGENGKKFKSVNLRKLLLSIQSESMERQRTIMEDAFESWRGDLEQIDDVCMIGVRI